MREEELEVAIKVVIVGNGGVGKSSMIQRYCKGTFTRDYKKTIGVDFLERQLELDGEEVRLMLWDTAGQEEFDAITKAYYRGAQACVLAFSTTDRDSFEAAHSWKLKVLLIVRAEPSLFYCTQGGTSPGLKIAPLSHIAWPVSHSRGLTFPRVPLAQIQQFD